MPDAQFCDFSAGRAARSPLFQDICEFREREADANGASNHLDEGQGIR
jgi:hypothetical protein